MNLTAHMVLSSTLLAAPGETQVEQATSTPQQHAQTDPIMTAPAASASGSLMFRQVEQQRAGEIASDNPTTSPISMFVVDRPRPTTFHKHDLIQIVVRETTRVQKKNEFETEKQWDLQASVKAFPHLSLQDIINLKLRAGDTPTSMLPKVDMDSDRSYEAEGEKKEQEDLTARLMSEIIEVLPNGNLILEARSEIDLDGEIAIMRVTGMCRTEDVTIGNTIMSNQLHDLKIERENKGELKRNSQKGLITKFFETLFNF